MLVPGPAKKVTIHLNEDTSAREDFLYQEVFSLLFREGVSGATMLRPEAGFGSHHAMHSVHGEGVRGEHLPVRVEFIETPERALELLHKLAQLVTDGLIEVQDTTIWKAAASRQ